MTDVLPPILILVAAILLAVSAIRADIPRRPRPPTIYRWHADGTPCYFVYSDHPKGYDCTPSNPHHR